MNKNSVISYFYSLDTEESGEERGGQSKADSLRFSISKPSNKTPFREVIEGSILKIDRRKSLSTKMSPNRSRNKVNHDLGCVYAHSGLFYVLFSRASEKSVKLEYRI